MRPRRDREESLGAPGGPVEPHCGLAIGVGQEVATAPGLVWPVLGGVARENSCRALEQCDLLKVLIDLGLLDCGFPV